jgi:hypothetical protein
MSVLYGGNASLGPNPTQATTPLPMSPPPMIPCLKRRTHPLAIPPRRVAWLLWFLGCLAALVPNTGNAACDDPPPPVRDIIADRFYIDPASTVADKAVVARNRTALATLDHTLNAILTMEDKVLAGDQESALCAGHWLAVWAKGGAMLGSMSSQQAVFERKLRTAGMAVGYLKVREVIDPAERTAIDAWFDELADHVVADQGLPNRRNNQV